VFLRLRPLSIVTGRLAVPEIIALEPQLTLARRLAVVRWNWEALFRNRPVRSPDERIRLPVVRLRNAEVIQVRVDERGRVRGRPQRIWAEARPTSGKPDNYSVELTKLAALQKDASTARETTRIEIDMRTSRVDGSLPTVALDDLLLTAPPEAVRWLDGCGLRGSIRAESFRYESQAGPTASLAVRDAALSLPIDDEERSLTPDRRFLKLDGIAGTIRIEQDQVELALQGQLRSRPVILEGTLRFGAGTDSSAIGFDLELRLSRVRLPRDEDARDPAERRFVQAWPVIAKQVRDFDGVGEVDVTMRLHREPRPDADVELVEGSVEFKGCSARYIGFPYRLDDLTGRVWIRPDGRFELLDIVGRHNRARVTVKGLLGGRLSNEGNLVVGAEDLVLDDDLLVCLDERDRELIGRFRPTARADVQVRMLRPATPLDRPPERWDTEIDIQFRDGTINLVDFPYPFDRLSGAMHIGKGRLAVTDFCASRGDVRACVSGTAEDEGEKGFSYDLELKADRVLLDETLRLALPAAGRHLFEKFQPAGHARVTGRLFTPSAGDALACDLKAGWAEGALTIPGTTERIDRCQAVLRVSPEQLTVESFEGRFGQSVLEADGRIPMGKERDLFLHVRSPRMALDDRLRAALPREIQPIWDRFHAEGFAAFDLRYGPGATGSRPASAPAGEAGVAGSQPSRADDYAITIEPLDCRARYDEFPLPLSDVTGRLHVTSDRILIDRIRAGCDGATIEGVGAVDVGPQRTLITLALDAANLPLNNSLRQALPWRLRRLWNDLEPAGSVDLSFGKLLLTCPAGGRVTWTFDGSARFDDVSLSLGPRLQRIKGELRASGEVGDEFSCQGTLDWAEALVEGWKTTHLTAAFARPPNSGTLRVDRLMADFYGGKVIGDAEIRDGPGGSEFGLSLTARDVSLGGFLNGRLRPGEQPVTLQGVVDGNLALTGRLGDVKSRHGGGTVLIHHAQMLKVPFILAMMQVVHLAIDDDNAFHDARLSFIVDADDLVFQEIDLRGKALSMVGAGRVNTPTEALDLVLLIGSPIKLPRMEVLSELAEGIARELVEVHVEGKLSRPVFRAEIVRSIRRAADTVFNAREKRPR